jgi:hypothetical protein
MSKIFRRRVRARADRLDFPLFALNANPPFILNVCSRFVHKPVRVTLTRGNSARSKVSLA